MEKHLILLAVVCTLYQNADAKCEGCKGDSFSCIDNSRNASCSDAAGGCPTASTEFRLYNQAPQVYPYAGENITLEFLLNETAVNSSVTVSLNETNLSLNNGSSDTYVYTLKNISKKDEGKSYLFRAKGYTKLVGDPVCSSVISTITYVFTVRVTLDRPLFVFIKGISSTIKIRVFAELPEEQFNQIQVLEISPHTSGAILTVDPEFDSETNTAVYHYLITNPVKKLSEGAYTFNATEFSKDGHTYSDVSAFQAYVHSTMIKIDKQDFNTYVNGNITMKLHITTDLDSFDDVTVYVTKPNGANETIELGDGKETDTVFIVSKVEKDDIGKYTFVASEHTADFGETFYENTVRVRAWNISSSLEVGEDSRYIAVKGQNNTVSCNFFGGDISDTAWWQNGAEVPKNTTESIYQLYVENEHVLYVTEAAEYSEATNYSCKNGEEEATVVIVVEGPPLLDLKKVDDAFICSVTGNPLPQVHWKLGEADFNGNTIISQSSVEKVESFHVISTITIFNSTFCLGDEILKCVASNRQGDDNTDITINKENIAIFESDYLIFSSTMSSYAEAITKCNGSVVTITTAEKEAAVRDSANRFLLEEFYIGATKENGTWKWRDGSTVSYFNDISGNGDCVKFYYDGTDWDVKAVACATPLNYVCEIRETNAPKNLNVLPVECDAAKLNVFWVSATGSSQKIVLNNNTDVVHKDTLRPGIESKHYENLLPNTDYFIKIYNINEDCKADLNPYIQATGTTNGPPESPHNVLISHKEDDACKVTWEYDGDIENLDKFTIKITETVVVDPDSVYKQTSREFNVSNDALEYVIITQPNTNYIADIFAYSCLGKSDSVVATGNCKTQIAAPSHVIAPLWKPYEDNEITTLMPPVDNRAGPVSCQFLVVRYIAPDDAPNVNESTFLEIKTADAENIEVGDEYFAYAREEASSEIDITIGNDTQKSSCIPLPAGTSKKRDVSRGQAFEAWNRALPYGIEIVYYLITTTPNEDYTKVYFANSEFSKSYTLHERDPPSNTSNATIIVLSIMAAIMVVVLAVIFYRKWKKRKGSQSSNRDYRFSFNKETSYDAL